MIRRVLVCSRCEVESVEKIKGRLPLGWERDDPGSPLSPLTCPACVANLLALLLDEMARVYGGHHTRPSRPPQLWKARPPVSRQETLVKAASRRSGGQ